MSSENSECRPVHMILSRLNGVRRRGKGWIARCPGHEDRWIAGKPESSSL